jgi:hypothetical protein
VHKILSRKSREASFKGREAASEASVGRETVGFPSRNNVVSVLQYPVSKGVDLK